MTWLCVSFATVLLYVYCLEMWQRMDVLTGLLNQNSYLNKTASMFQNGTLIVFDVDDFKQGNDTYGHLTGDRCLEAVGKCIQKAYAKNGLCYRVGGDEFCVLLNEGADPELCRTIFERKMEQRRKVLSVLPNVSVGSERFTVGDDIRRVKRAADQTMYQAKKMKKESKQETEQESVWRFEEDRLDLQVAPGEQPNGQVTPD